MVERIHFPSRSQWARFREAKLTGVIPASISVDSRVNIQVPCLHCQRPVDVSRGEEIRIGTLCKVIEEEVVEGSLFTVAGLVYQEPERLALTTKIFPMIMKGLGCGNCTLEMLRAAKQVKGVGPEPYKEQVPVTTVQWAGETFVKRDDRWYTQGGIAVPSSRWGWLESRPSATRVEERVRLRIPSKRVAFIDVREEVLGMRRV